MNATVIFGLVFALLGVLPAVIPDKLAKLRFWAIKDAEPSDAFVAVTRIIGIAMILIGLCVAGSKPIL
jgi:hypothetical protein